MDTGGGGPTTSWAVERRRGGPLVRPQEGEGGGGRCRPEPWREGRPSPTHWGGLGRHGGRGGPPPAVAAWHRKRASRRFDQSRGATSHRGSGTAGQRRESMRPKTLNSWGMRGKRTATLGRILIEGAALQEGCILVRGRFHKISATFERMSVDVQQSTVHSRLRSEIPTIDPGWRGRGHAL